MDNVGGVGPVQGPKPLQPSTSSQPVEGERSFQDILKDSIDRVNGLQKEADMMYEKMQAGQANEEEVTVAFQKARIAFEALMQIRNKLVDAFDQIQQMRI